MELSGKVTVIVGGGRGIGRAGALALADAGSDIAIADVDVDAAHATASDVAARGRRSLAVPCEAGNEAAVHALAKRVGEELGPVDVLWLHAGRSIAGPPESIPLTHWRDLFDLNVLGGVLGLQAFLPGMVSRGTGHIVLTSSGLGLFPADVPGLAAPYVVTKAAQVALARTLAPYLRARGVGITVLVPDATATRHATDVPTVGLDPAVVAATIDASSMQAPEQVAERLVRGLREDRFLVSAVPDTRERLIAEAEREYAPLPPPSGPVVHYVRVQADATRHAELAAVLDETARRVREEPGMRSFHVGAGLEGPGVFHLLEEWESTDHFEQHAARPESQALLALMPEFGITGLTTRLYGISTVDGRAVDGPGRLPSAAEGRR